MFWINRRVKNAEKCGKHKIPKNKISSTKNKDVLRHEMIAFDLKEGGGVDSLIARSCMCADGYTGGRKCFGSLAYTSVSTNLLSD